ncbi:MAG: phage portal protein [Acidobacteria bacterium]|nr:phage portal protein [Acidobacteriota bacterium]
MLPGVLTAFRPAGVANVMPKPTAANLRRFAETPLARRAINVVKDRIACMDWQVRWKRDADLQRMGKADLSTADAKSASFGRDDDSLLRILRRCLEAPNPGDSFRTLMEQVIEDVLVGGFGAMEMELTGDEAAPFRLWPVDGATIQVDGKWSGDESEPRYAQANGLQRTALLDAELMYVRLNARTHTPFGLGRLEVAFEAISQFLQANRYAHRLASNSSAQFALWLQDATPEQHGRMVQWWRDCVEGSGEVPIFSTETKPEVLRFSGGTDADLRLEWQEFLMRMIANAFDLPPMMLGVQHDVNRSTATELAQEAFESAVKPVAKLVAEHITRDLFAKRLGLTEVEFVFNELMTEDDAKDVSVQVELLKAGVLTVDEVRRTLGCSAHGDRRASRVFFA